MFWSVDQVYIQGIPNTSNCSSFLSVFALYRLREGQFERPKLEHVELRPYVLRALARSAISRLPPAAPEAESKEGKRTKRRDGRSSGNFSLQILGHHCRLLRLPARPPRGSLAPVEIKSPSCGTTMVMAVLLVLDATDPQHAALALLWKSSGTP